MKTARTTVATLTTVALAVGSLGGAALAQDAAMAEPGQDLKVMLLPKFTDNQVFQQANEGAQEAALELGVPTPLDFVGPASTDTGSAQVAFVVNAPTQEYDVLLISNNVGEEMADAAVAAQGEGIKVVTWDSPIASGNGEDVFVAQVDFDETGVVMADMALNILPEGGQMAVLSAKPESPNQNAWIAAMEVALADPKYAGIELVEIVFGNDNIADSEAAAIGLIDQWPDLSLIMAPTTEGIKAAAKVVTDDGLCDQIKISGLGLPSEMESYTLDGCAPEIALWSFVDLGYLSYYVGYLLATGALEGVAGETFEVGREISGQTTFEITADPTRPDVDALRVLMGPFSVYDASNISG
jgi:rhamnose transport system substrate-binding protein